MQTSEQTAACDCSVQHHRVRGRSTLHCNRHRLDCICSDGLPCESRGSQAAPPIALQMGAVVTPNAVRKHRMPLRTRGSTECLYPVFSPTVFNTARAFVLHRQMAVQTAIPSLQHIALENSAAWLLRGACCRHLWVCRRSPLQRNSAWAMLIPKWRRCTIAACLCKGSAALTKRGTLKRMQTNAASLLASMTANQQPRRPKAASFIIFHRGRAGFF
jgi:hypothetical protein